MTLTGLLEKVRGFDPERLLGLRPSYPPLALALDGGEALLVRLGRRGAGGRATIERLGSQPLAPGTVPASIFHSELGPQDELVLRLRALFDGSGIKPGRLSLVLPDNLAKVSLVTLPERPGSRRQLEQILRFRMRRAVPFRLEDAALSYQIVEERSGAGMTVLLALMRRAVLEHYEQALITLGARPGLVDLATPNLINLCQAQIAAAAGGGDVALLNCTASYFTLCILRAGRLIFFRCKTFGSEGDDSRLDEMLAREVAGSFSYYQEKLAGEAVSAMLVRSAPRPVSELLAVLRAVGLDHAVPLDIAQCVEPPAGETFDTDLGQRAAPALGAAAGRVA